MLEAGASRLIGLDRDPAALADARDALSGFGDRVELVHADYRGSNDVLDARGVTKVDGVLADLGVSSMQLDSPGRGFSFRQDDPLDMRMDTTAGPTAAELDPRRGRADAGGSDLRVRRGAALAADRPGDCRGAATGADRDDRTARGHRPARDSAEGYTRIDPATRTFQAIRIWVNRELDGLDTFLGTATRRLADGGRMAVITFHSLEDRIVKHTLRALQAEGFGLRIRTKRPVVPSEAEIERNPRARSAKLRAAEMGQAS